MATPTQRLTKRAAEVLGEDVVLALRVRRRTNGWTRAADTEDNDATYDDGAWHTLPEPSAEATMLPAGGFPIVPLYRRMKHAVTNFFVDQSELDGVLAFTASGDRVLMKRSRYRSLHPTGEIRRLRTDRPIVMDTILFEDRLVPELEVGGELFNVDSIDFGVFIRAVVDDKIHEPELADALRPYHDKVKSLATFEPRQMKKLIDEQFQPEKSDV